MNKSSRHLFSGKRFAALALLGSYLCGVFIGCFIIWLIPIAKSKSNLMDIAADKGEEVLSAGRLEKVMIFGMEHWLYNDSGILISKETAFLHTSQYEYIKSFVPKILESGSLYSPTLLLLDNRDDEPKYIFGIVAGVTVTGPNGRPFVSILARDLSDLDTIMITYIVLFTFMFFIATLLMTNIVKKERELNRMRRDLIANVSHELKTPITAIRAMAETLHDGIIEETRTKQIYSGKIMEESDKLEQLVLDILELSRLQSKRAKFIKRVTHADGIIPPVVDRYIMLCGDMGIELNTSGLDLESIPPLFTDTEKLITLMNILLDNAVKFTGAGGTIWITDQVNTKNATFCIRDNGPGICPEDMSRIFERFYKADVAHNSSGSGLGLAIAQEIAKGLGEELWAESVYGSGSSFFFTVSFK